MKKILILTAERTGNGHKSAANALEKKLESMGYSAKQIDCFTTMGKLGMALENAYIPLTTRTPILFYIPFKISQHFPNLIHSLMYIFSKRNITKEIKDFDPDLIISVHSMFTKSVSNILKKKDIDTPFYINVIDLVDPPKLWQDKNADVIFLPNEEIKESYIEQGFSKDNLIVSGFPIRDDIERRTEPKQVKDNINILLVNPSVNLKKNFKYVKEVSKIKNSTITVICGRDKRMYNYLIKMQQNGKIPATVKIYEFVKNMNEFLDNAHVLLTKAGPNMILEGARSATAVVVTGHILGQENKNYEYVTKNNFGFKCENPKKIYKKLNEFINSSELEKCLKNVIHSDCNNGTDVIAEFIAKKEEEF